MASRASVSSGAAAALALGMALSAGIACITPFESAHALEAATPLAVAQPPSIVPALVGSPGDGESAADLEQVRALAAEREAARAAERRDKRLDYDPALIAAIGNQQASGHSICCPSYACAYGDAVLAGQARDHSAYTCGCCTWPGWAGGDSSFRSLGSDDALLREAYDEIAAGRPTVIHVAGAYGEHWICLVGYQDVEDPATLSLDNFIALDPFDGLEATASDGYSLYGDACEHVSDRR